MKKIRCLLADDEPIARQILEKYIQEIPYLELVGQCKNAFEVLEILQTEDIGLLFLDINMPKLSGLSLLKSMRIKPEVIITTAYSEYALEGFELAVADYLLKPFSFERFMQAVMKVQQKQNITTIPSPISTQENLPTSLFIKSDKKLIKVAFEDITHVEAYGNYIKVYANKMILSPITLSDFLDKLPSDFMRIHKSFVVNFTHLQSIEGNLMTLHNDVKLTIGKSYRKAVLERVNG